MLPWLRTPWRSQAGFGQGGKRSRRLAHALEGDFNNRNSTINLY
jgi:hypothetical protein